jgi:16S rRNA (cytidine1402-2'-O)-methyltransferase
MARSEQSPAQSAAPSARGRLEVVATPIGNLADISARARATLGAADVIAAEDTRRTRQLLNNLGISRPLRSLNAYNESERLDELLQQLQSGRTVALVSDAGTPLLSDPGFALVRAAIACGIEVRAVPGASALTAALSVAGLPIERFAFEGFLPARARERRALLAQLATEPRTLVLFEAPHRIGATLAELAELFGADRQAVIARELTKLHETIYRGSVGELAARARSDPDMARGELTLLLAGATRASSAAAGADAALLVRALQLLLAELPPPRAAAIAAQLAGVTRDEAYELARRLRAESQ